MAYLNDTEKRLLFSALSREKETCKQVDKECYREPYEDTLESVVKGLEKKFYYDRFEKEIRAKAIDEFAEKLNNSIDMLDLNYEYRCDGGVQHQTLNNMREIIQELSEQLKVGDNNE